MKAYIFAAAAVVAGGMAWGLVPPATPEGVDPLVSGSIRRDAVQKAFAITSLDGGRSCVAERGAPVSYRSRLFTAPSDCNAVWPGLASVKNWTENEDGTVILSNASGEAVLTMAEGSDAGYEAMEPSEARISLLAVE